MSNLHGTRIHMMSWERNFIQSVNYMFDIKSKNGILSLGSIS
jgi:hypothetical protein